MRGIGARLSWSWSSPSRGSAARVWPTAASAGSGLAEAVRATAWRQNKSRDRSRLCRPGWGLGGCTTLSTHGSRRGPHYVARLRGLKALCALTLAPMPCGEGKRSLGALDGRQSRLQGRPVLAVFDRRRRRRNGGVVPSQRPECAESRWRAGSAGWVVRVS
jgi:hypothetical protein